MTTHLKGMTWDHPRGYEPLVACSTQYANEHDVEINWDIRSLKDFGDQPIDELASTYDILIIDHPHAGLAAATGCLLPLDEWIPIDSMQRLAAESAGASHYSYAYDGHQWALALDAAMQTAVYREDLLNGEAPMAWDEVLSLGESIRADGCYIAIPLVPTDAMCSFITLCANLGEPLSGDEDLVSRETGIAALEMLRALTDIAHPDSLDWNPIHALDHMSSANDVVYCPLTFCYTNYGRMGQYEHLLTFTGIPGIRGSILGGTGFAVSSFSEHKQKAVEFGAWVCSASVQSGLYVQSMGQPGNITAWHNDQANALTNTFFRNTLPTLEQAYIRPQHHGFVPFQEEAGIKIHKFLRERTDAGECFDHLAQSYKEFKS